MAQIATRQGRGVPRGSQGGGGRDDRSSPWENTFRNRLKEFQRKEEEEELEETARPRTLSTSSQAVSSPAKRTVSTASFQGGVCKDISQQSVSYARRRSSGSSPTPTPSASTTPTPPPPQRPGSRTSQTSQTSARFLVDETGQKERMLPDSQSSQSQSDDSEREDTLSQQLSTLAVQNRSLQLQIRESERERERLSSLLETNRSFSPDISSSGKPLPSQLLDGRLLVQEGADSGDRGLQQHHFVEDEEEDESSVDLDSHQSELIRLQEENSRLERKLAELTEKVDSLQKQVDDQRARIADGAELNSDLQKDIEVLRNENCHVSAELGRVESERDGAVSSNQELREKLVACEKKLSQVESVYREVGQQNRQLEEELSAVTTAHKNLVKENDKLDQEVKDVRKTKENFRTTITKLREQNTSLENKMTVVVHEKESLAADQRRAKSEQEQSRLDIVSLREERDSVQQQVNQLEKKLTEFETEKSSLSAKLEQTKSLGERTKKELDESLWEREQLKTRLSTVTQREQKLANQHAKIMEEITTATKDTRQKVPGLKEEKAAPVKVVATGGSVFTSHDQLPAEVTQLKALLSAVIKEIGLLRDQRKLLDVKLTKLESQLQKREENKQKDDQAITQLEEKIAMAEEQRTELAARETALRLELEQSRNREDELKREKEKIEEERAELKHQLAVAEQHSIAMSEEMEQIRTAVADKESELDRAVCQVSRLLAERTCAIAQLVVMKEKNAEQQLDSIADKTARIDELTNQIAALTVEREEHQAKIEGLSKQHKGAMQELQTAMEENRTHKMDHDKLKMQLMTELSLLRSKVSQLEEENTAMKLTSPAATSAFHPVTSQRDSSARKVTFLPNQEKSQQQITELQHKVSALEAENKRLVQERVLTGSGSAAGSTGGSQDMRRQLQELRRKQHFAELEKKQLTDKLSSLQSTLRIMRESKEKNSSERFVALQDENASLHDRVRSLEESFTRKQMIADQKISDAIKENDRFRHKLSALQQGLESMEQLEQSLRSATLSDNLSALSSDGGAAIQRLLQVDTELQIMLSCDQSDTSEVRSTTPTIPPLQLPSDVFHSSHPRVARSQSASSSGLVLLKEKLTQLHSCSTTIAAAIQQNKDSTPHQRDKLSSLLKETVTQLHTTHGLLSHLQQSDISSEQLNSISLLEKQVEKWQDKVIARDMALKDIDAQMRMDYESHDHTFSQLKSQLLSLRDELSTKIDTVHAKDQYIQEMEGRCLSAENECIGLRKEMERAMQEALKVPEVFQLPGHNGNIVDVVHSLTEQLHQLKSVYNEYSYELSQLRSKIDSSHRENTVLKQQGLEMERHHLQMREELQAERDFLRQVNLQLIEQQSKDEECIDVIEMIKDCRDTVREQQDAHKLASELASTKLRLREQEMRIAELDHQLEEHRQSLKLVPLSVPSAEMMVVPQQHKFQTVSSGRGYLRPHSASSADAARTPHYNILTGYNHPTMVRRTLPHTLEDDFTITLGDGPGESLNLNDQSDFGVTAKRYVGLPVVTDDDEKDGSNLLEHKHHRSKFRRHRRTASTGSSNFANFFSETPLETKPPVAPPSSSATLPLAVVKQQQVHLSRPVSADSTRYEAHSPPTGATAPATTSTSDRVSMYARNVAENIDMLTTQSDEEVSKERHGPAKPEPSTSKFRFPRYFRSQSKQNSSTKQSGAAKPPTGKAACKPPPQQQDSDISSRDTEGSSARRKQANNDTTSSGDNAAQVSRMPSMASSVGRSDSFVSTSTTFSGRESSPYSTVSNDSLLIADSIDNLQQLSFTQQSPFNVFNTNRFTPIPHPHYLTSSSDEDNRSYPRVTLRPSTSSVSTTSSQLFQPLASAHHRHHRANSSCDSDQLQSHSELQLAAAQYGIGLPGDGPCISDIEQCSTDDDLHDKIRHLAKKLGRVRRSSTGSITIFNNSGGSMEDIKAGD